MSTIDRVRAGAVTPGLVAFLLSPRLRGSPYPLYRALRSLDPVHRSPMGLYLLTRHADVMAALRNPVLGSDEREADTDLVTLGPLDGLFRRRGGFGNAGPFITVFREVMLFRDAPDHTRLRSLASKAFTPTRAEAMAPRIAELVAERLDAVASRHHMEVMSELAYPLPAIVICELLGVPAEDAPMVVGHAPALATGLDPGPMRTAAQVAAADAATVELSAYLRDLIEKRRAEPRDDLLSALVAAEEGGERLSSDELVAMVILLLIAGHETTANLVGNGLVALLRNRDQLHLLRGDVSLDKPAVEELLRYDSPVQMTQRVALDDVEVAGERVQKGRMLVLVTGAANRDPEVFEHPDRLDLTRNPNHHIAFGGGSHFCLGAALARVEARIILGHLVRRFPGLRLEGRPKRRPSFTIRGLSELHVAW